MLRSVLGVIVGYIVMFVLQVAVFMTIYTMMGPEWSFKPASYEASTQWTIMQMIVILVTGAIAGLVCAIIARGGKAPLVLAGLVLALGLVLGTITVSMKKNEPIEIRTGDVPNMVAMSKARHPLWVIYLGAVLGAVGVAIGGKLKRQS
jgi:prepilin signal peptidase PulO-like enzyme (type II secretory pathway)